jgi:large subunit ribosomal protein L18
VIKKQSRNEVRIKRHYRLRNKLSGAPTCPRLCVFRSNKHIYAQVIDDTAGKTLASSSTMDKGIASGLKSTSNIEAAKVVGESIAKKVLDLGIEAVVFDRGGYLYHGKVKALADSAREAGLKF